ncbi:MAG: hypothetical protein SGBAC_012042, partial [Bacillariaceae sp.]
MSFLASLFHTLSFDDSENSSDNEEKEITSQGSVEGRARQLKARLRSLLKHHDGSTEHTDVVDAIHSLSKLCPCNAQSPQWLDLFMGEFFVQTSPNFPGRLPPAYKGDERVQYTLDVRNVVAPKPDDTFTYHLICDIIIHTPEGDVEAEIRNESYCCKDDYESNRVHVFFTGSKLSPAQSVIENNGLMALWSKIFNEATLKAAAAKRSYFGWMMDQILKRMLGMNVRLDDSHSFCLEFKKSIRGYIDVLYLDEEMRITKGNRGTLVVVERIQS